MRILYSVLICLGLAFSAYAQPSTVLDINGVWVMKGQIVAKLKPSFYKSPQSEVVLAGIKKYGVNSIEARFPTFQRDLNPEIPRKDQFGLKRIITIQMADVNADPNSIIPALQKTGYFEYVQPWYVPQPLYTPNDSLIGQQYQLGLIKAFQAWDINKGDTNMVIGISDTGFDMDHPDLKGNYKRNYKDPINGLDDDNDGYIDNFNGWDLGDNDNDPSLNPLKDPYGHGTIAAGASSARTDNKTGVAGTGFKCKFMAIKGENMDGVLNKAYDGLVYAVDHGCKVVNASFGSKAQGGFETDLVNYIVIEKDASLIAAAGNETNSDPYYPASLDNVLSVCSTDKNDIKVVKATYNTFVDISAPGDAPFTTGYDNKYSGYAGSSFACPLVAGAVALVRCLKPQLSGLEAMDIVKYSSDKVDNLSGNANFVGKLGFGRLNMFKALVDAAAPKISFQNIKANKAGAFPFPNLFFDGDTVSLTGNFFAESNPTTKNCKAVLNGGSMVVMIDSVYKIGKLKANDSIRNTLAPFIFRIKDGVPIGTALPFNLTITDSAYNKTYSFTISTSSDFLNIKSLNLSSTMTGDGGFCYANGLKTLGQGMIYKGKQVNNESGIMMRFGPKQIVDVISGPTPNSRSNGFKRLTIPQQSFNIKAPIYYSNKFRVNDTINNPAMTIKAEVFAWNGIQDSSYFILNYTLYAPKNKAVSGLDFGLFNDWDLKDAGVNAGVTDMTSNTSYAIDADSLALYASMTLLSGNPIKVHFEERDIIRPPVNLGNGFDTDEKEIFFNEARPKIGVPAGTADIVQFVHTDIPTINAGDSVKVAWIMAVGYSESNIKKSIQTGKTRWSQYNSMNEANLEQSWVMYPNPGKNFVVINAPIMSKYQLLSMEGKSLMQGNIDESGEIKLNIAGISKGIYIVQITNNQRSSFKKLIVD